MKEIFHPKSIVVIGASTRRDNMARNIVWNLITFNFKGRIHLVGGKTGHLFGHPIRRSVKEIRDKPDLAVFLIPARKIPAHLTDCGEKGIKFAVIESSGFTEYGEEGRALEEEVVGIAKQYDIRFIGPNGLGVISAGADMNVVFMPIQPMQKGGSIDLLSQSGGVGSVYLNSFRAESLHVDKFVSMGNKLSICESDILEYLAREETSSMVCLYLEDIKDGRRFFEVTRDYPEPLLVQKSNVNETGARMASSHTAAMAADDRTADALFRQNAIVRVEHMASMLDHARIFTFPPMRGNNLAVISRSGGHAVISADYS